MSKPWDHLRTSDKPVVHPIKPGAWNTHGTTCIEYVSHRKNAGGHTDIDVRIAGDLIEMTLRSWRDFHGFLGELLDQLEGK